MRRASFALVVVLLASLAPAARADGVPQDFFGIVPQGDLAPADYEQMGGVVGTLRIPILWPEVEPHPGEYRFADLDLAVASAAAAGMRVLPFVYGTPSWLEPNAARPPLASSAEKRAWTNFLVRLVQRYGPGGEAWQGRARAPIRRWQIWNEPNFLLFWRPRPSPRAYAELLRISARAIRAQDRRAKIVSAGVAPVEAGMRPWGFLREMYEVDGVRRDFDYVGLHPYAPRVRWVGEQIELVRQAMAAGGDARKPLLLTELGVASGGTYPNAFDKGSHGQAAYLSRVFGLLVSKRRAWRIAGVDWFTWRDSAAADPHCVFCEYGGLFDAAGSPKPAWWAFKRAIAAARRNPVR